MKTYFLRQQPSIRVATLEPWQAWANSTTKHGSRLGRRRFCLLPWNIFNIITLKKQQHAFSGIDPRFHITEVLVQQSIGKLSHNNIQSLTMRSRFE